MGLRDEGEESGEISWFLCFNCLGKRFGGSYLEMERRWL